MSDSKVADVRESFYGEGTHMQQAHRETHREQGDLGGWSPRYNFFSFCLFVCLFGERKGPRACCASEVTRGQCCSLPNCPSLWTDCRPRASGALPFAVCAVSLNQQDWSINYPSCLAFCLFRLQNHVFSLSSFCSGVCICTFSFRSKNHRSKVTHGWAISLTGVQGSQGPFPYL